VVQEQKRLEPKERREQILNAAVDIARTEGFHKLTRDGVAERAKVSYGLVTRYFGTIETLKQHVMRRAVADSIPEIIAAGLAMKDPIARTATDAAKKEAISLMYS